MDEFRSVADPGFPTGGGANIVACHSPPFFLDPREGGGASMAPLAFNIRFANFPKIFGLHAPAS